MESNRPGSSSGDVGSSPLVQEALSFIQNIIRLAETHKIASLIVAFYIGPHFFNTQFSPYKEVFPHSTILIAVTLLVFAYKSTSFSCHLRYAYLQWKPLVNIFDTYLGTWTFGLILVGDMLLPYSFIWLIAISLLAWHYILFHHREAVRKLTIDVDESCFQAKIALDRALDAVSTAKEYEKQALATAEKTQRNFRLGQSVKATDFFGQSNTAWAAMDQIGTPLDAMTKEAENVLKKAKKIKEADADRLDDQHEDTQGEGSDSGDEQDDEPEETIAELLVKEAEKALESCKKADQQMKYAMANIRASKKASDRNEQARKIEENNVKDVIKFGKSLTKQVGEMLTSLAESGDAHAKTKWQAEKAIMLATHGEMDAANMAAAAAKNEFNKVKLVHDKLVLALDAARVMLVAFQLRDLKVTSSSSQ